ncbi:MAG: iron-containing alcohol dehydrogenase [Candidatus Methanomethylicia archaeon]
MKIHTIFFPKKVVIGHKALKMIDNVLNDIVPNGNERIIVFTDEYSQSYLSLINSTIRNYDFHMVSNETGNIINQINQYSAVISLGGWKIINFAKHISHKYHIPLISIPTTISNEDVVNPKIVYKINGSYKFLISNLPAAIIIDLSMINKNSKEEILSGLCDILSKSNAISDLELCYNKKCKYYSEYAVLLIKTSIQIVLKNLLEICAGKEAGLQTLIEALIGCGFAMGISNSRYVCEGAEHLFLYALESVEGYYNLNHGKICLIGAIIGQYLHGRNWLKMKRILEQIKIFSDIKSFKLTRQNIIRALELAPKLDSDLCTIFSRVRININNIIEILKECEIID